MKIIHKRLTSKGLQRMTIELQPDETLIAVRQGVHYKLGYPVEDIVSPEILADAAEVVWCSASQKWVE